jgi:hypothetical protein
MEFNQQHCSEQHWSDTDQNSETHERFVSFSMNEHLRGYARWVLTAL